MRRSHTRHRPGRVSYFSAGAAISCAKAPLAAVRVAVACAAATHHRPGRVSCFSVGAAEREVRRMQVAGPLSVGRALVLLLLVVLVAAMRHAYVYTLLGRIQLKN